MKRLAAITVLLLFVVGVGTAHAFIQYDMQFLNTYRGENLSLTANGGYHNTSAGVYTLNRTLDGVTTSSSDFFCLDLEHNVWSGSTWKANLHVLPPDYHPANPPPTNLWLAGWAMQEYGLGTTAADAAGMQLALWEMTHDKTFGANDYLVATWATTGSVTTGGSYGTGSQAARDRATTILTGALGAGFHPPLARYVEYYEPAADGDPSQGMLRLDGEVPEPTSLILLGSMLLGAAGLSLRRRTR